jgi:hypothetical protein
VSPNGGRRVWRTPALRADGANDVLIRDYFRDAVSGPVLWSSATAVPKGTFEDVGGFPEGVRLGEDLDMWMRIAARFPIAVSPYVGAVYRQDAGNRTDDGRIKGVPYELVRTGSRLLSSAALNARQRRHLREYVSMYQIVTAAQLVLLGRREEARTMLSQCRTRRFLLRKGWWLFWALIPPPIVRGVREFKRRMAGTSERT